MRENISILPRSRSRTPNRNSTSGASDLGASGPQHADTPTNSVSRASNSSPSRFQNRASNAFAFASASGPEMMSVPLAFQPSPYAALILSDGGAGRPTMPHTRTRSLPSCSNCTLPKSAITSGVM